MNLSLKFETELELKFKSNSNVNLQLYSIISRLSISDAFKTALNRAPK